MSLPVLYLMCDANQHGWIMPLSAGRRRRCAPAR